MGQYYIPVRISRSGWLSMYKFSRLGDPFHTLWGMVSTGLYVLDICKMVFENGKGDAQNLEYTLTWRPFVLIRRRVRPLFRKMCTQPYQRAMSQRVALRESKRQKRKYRWKSTPLERSQIWIMYSSYKLTQLSCRPARSIATLETLCLFVSAVARTTSQ